MLHDITEILLNIRTLNINYITYFCKKQGDFLPVKSQFFFKFGDYIYISGGMKIAQKSPH
jgi:hypothetical protein